MDPDEIGNVDGKWLEFIQDHVLWCALVLAVLNLQVLLRETELISKMDF
jgi:hypothetical protein